MVSKKAAIHVLLGTRKGAFIFQSDSRRRKWRMKGPFFENAPVFHMSFDRRDGKTIYAAVNSGHFGPTVQRTKNFGRSWENSKTPPRFVEGSGLKVENVWHVEPGHSDEPDVIYAGVAPAGLFRSEDGGDNWKLNENLNNHPTRPKWQPGAGGLCLHSIIIDPSRAKRMYLGISAVIASSFSRVASLASWKILAFTVAMTIVAQAVHIIESMLTLGYYMDSAYFGVWSKIMMPGPGPPPAGFYYYSVIFALITWAFFGFAYEKLGRAISEKNVFRKGLQFGGMIFLIAGIPSLLSVYLLINLPRGLLAAWTTTALILYLIGGVLAAKLMKNV